MCATNVSCVCWYWPRSLARVVFVSFLHCKGILSPSSILCSLEGSSLFSFLSVKLNFVNLVRIGIPLVSKPLIPGFLIRSPSLKWWHCLFAFYMVSKSQMSFSSPAAWVRLALWGEVPKGFTSPKIFISVPLAHHFSSLFVLKMSFRTTPWAGLYRNREGKGPPGVVQCDKPQSSRFVS